LFYFGPGDPEIAHSYLAQGPFPWWTLPDFKAHFFRPLSSALIVLDHSLFGRAAVWYHAHSILWYVLLVLGWGMILRKSLPGPVAVLALVIFALDDAHLMPTVWLANRNALVATVPTLFGLYAHIRWREDGWLPGLPLSLVGYVVGLAGGETALCVLAYLGAYELFAAPGSLFRRALALLPVGLLGIVYILIYKIFDYGTYGSDLYLDPVAEPLVYLSNAPSRLFALLANLLVGLPADLWLLHPVMHLLLAFGGVLAVVLFAYLLRNVWNGIDARQRRALRWMIPGGVLSLLPVVATFPSIRLLLTASFGGSVLVAVILVQWWPLRKPWRDRPFFIPVGYFLVVLNFLVPVITWPAVTNALRQVGREASRAYVEAEIPTDLTERDRVVLLVVGDPLSCLYPPVIRELEGGYAYTYSWLTLSAAFSAHRITRTDTNRIEVEALAGNMLATEIECLVRTSRIPFAPDDQVDLDDVLITILEVGEKGVKRVAFEFDRSIDDPTLHFIMWRDGRLRKADMPGVGESLEIPLTTGLI